LLEPVQKSPHFAEGLADRVQAEPVLPEWEVAGQHRVAQVLHDGPVRFRDGGEVQGQRGLLVLQQAGCQSPDRLREPGRGGQVGADTQLPSIGVAGSEFSAAAVTTVPTNADPSPRR
jgi:hypothetical protein